MNPRLFILPFLLVIVNVDPARASVARPALEVLEQLGKAAGRSPGRGAVEALQRAVSREGDAALEAARRGGLDLAEAAARHGDEVFSLAVRIPEAAPALAARADELLPLVRRHGYEILHLEGALPGLADDAARLFPERESLRRLSVLPPDQARMTIAYADRAVDAGAPQRLLDAVEQSKGAVLHRLDAKKILALGLSTAMVVAATGGSVSAITAPEPFFEAVTSLGFPIASTLALVLAVMGAISAIALARRLGVGKRRDRKTGGSADSADSR
jgi:hypothetical protein